MLYPLKNSGETVNEETRYVRSGRGVLPVDDHSACVRSKYVQADPEALNRDEEHRKQNGEVFFP
jgi:hypothetical protein